MEYVWRQASPALAPFVEGLWFLRGRAPSRIERILPMLTPHLVVNLADETYRVSDDGDTRNAAGGAWRPLGDVFCSGMRTRVAFSANPEPILNAGAVIRADGLPGLGLDPGWLAERVTTVQPTPPDGTRGAEPEAALDALEGYLVARLRPDAVDPLVRTVLQRLTEDASTPVSALAAELGISHPGLVGRFRRRTGISPKLYGELVRFHRMIDLIPLPDAVAWSDLASDSGYYDQSHAIRSFRRFAGMTPAVYYRRVRDYGADAVRFIPADGEPGSGVP